MGFENLEVVVVALDMCRTRSEPEDAREGLAMERGV